MKKILFLIAVLTVTFTVSAQSLPKEFGKYRRSVTPVAVSNNPLLDKSVSDGIFIISQSYQLEDSVGRFFGVSGKREFGSDNNIALMVKDGYILFEKTKSPWEYNPSFKKFKKRYTPQLFPTQYSILSEKAHYDSIPYNEKDLVTVFPEEIYAMPTNFFFNDGFTTGHSEGTKEGYLVWITRAQNLDIEENTKLNVISYPQTIEEVSDRSVQYDINRIDTSDEILGVIYVVPENTGIGRVDFILHGIGIVSEGCWTLICPFTESGSVFNTSAPILQEDEIDVELTPNLE